MKIGDQVLFRGGKTAWTIESVWIGRNDEIIYALENKAKNRHCNARVEDLKLVKKKTFYVFDKVGLTGREFEEAKSVAAFLLGRQLNKYVIIKSVEGREDAYYKPTTGDCFAIQKELERL